MPIFFATSTIGSIFAARATSMSLPTFLTMTRSSPCPEPDWFEIGVYCPCKDAGDRRARPQASTACERRTLVLQSLARNRLHLRGSVFSAPFVIHAKAGIQGPEIVPLALDSRFSGN